MNKKFCEIVTPMILINSGIAWGLVFFGAFLGGSVSLEAVIGAFGGAMVAFLTQLKVSIANKPKSKLTGVFAFI